MKLYNKEKKEILELELELAMENLSRCIKFEARSGKTHYEFEQLLEEYRLIKNVRADLVCSNYYGEDLAVCDTDYLLLKKWGWLNLRTYKDLSSNIEE